MHAVLAADLSLKCAMGNEIDARPLQVCIVLVISYRVHLVVVALPAEANGISNGVAVPAIVAKPRIQASI